MRKLMKSALASVIVVLVAVCGARLVAESWSDAVFPVLWIFGPWAFLMFLDDLVDTEKETSVDDKDMT